MYKCCVFFLFLFASFYIKAQTGIIVTIAGNGQNVSAGDGGPASTAKITANGAGIIDKFQNLYFTEGPGNRIRKISPAGIIDSAAGTGALGFSGDGGPATEATLRNPKHLATDKHGNLYIADAANHRVRKVDAVTGIISTFAGNGTNGYTGNGDSAKLASLTYPYGICCDPIGNIYITEQGNSTIRKIDTFGIISVYAGIPGSGGYSGDGGPALSAQLIAVNSLCSDTNGNIYVIAGNNVRRIDAITNVITTVAGISNFGYNGDNIPANTASLFSPFAITIDNENNLIIADTKNNRVRKVDELGIITTIVGTGNVGFNGDSGLATAADIYWPEGVAYDSCGNLYINDLGNFRIRKVIFNDTCGQTSVSSVISKNSEVSIYPNPTSSELTIAGNNIASITITNTLGQIVHWQKVNAGKTVVDMSVLHTGVYFVTITDKHGAKVTKKVVKE